MEQQIDWEIVTKLRRMQGHLTVDTAAAIAALAEGRLVYAPTPEVPSCRVEEITAAAKGPYFEVRFETGHVRVVLAAATFWVERPAANPRSAHSVPQRV